jgi:hypothetical protein
MIGQKEKEIYNLEYKMAYNGSKMNAATQKIRQLEN